MMGSKGFRRKPKSASTSKIFLDTEISGSVIPKMGLVATKKENEIDIQVHAQ